MMQRLQPIRKQLRLTPRLQAAAHGDGSSYDGGGECQRLCEQKGRVRAHFRIAQANNERCQAQDACK